MKLNLSNIERLVESLMVDHCIITRPDPDSPGVFDDNTGLYTGGSDPVEVYAGDCMVTSQAVSGQDTAGGELRQAVIYWLSVPKSVEDIQPEDICTVDAVHTDGDQSLIGNFVISDDLGATYAVQRRIQMTRYGTVPQ